MGGRSAYYSELLATKDAQLLNQQFTEIKLALEQYLISENSKSISLSGFETLFSTLKNNIVVSFNYTSTESHYSNNFDEIIKIHGELSNPKNPIIFGYATDERATQELLDKNNDSYLENIKQFEYLGSTNYQILNEIVGKYKYVNIHILGHSCALSDKLILTNLFRKPNVKKIFNYYYKDRFSHLKKLVNINRTVGQDIGFDKFMPLPQSLEMPNNLNGITSKQVNEFITLNKKYGL